MAFSPSADKGRRGHLPRVQCRLTPCTRSQPRGRLEARRGHLPEVQCRHTPCTGGNEGVGQGANNLTTKSPGGGDTWTKNPGPAFGPRRAAPRDNQPTEPLVARTTTAA